MIVCITDIKSIKTNVYWYKTVYKYHLIKLSCSYCAKIYSKYKN
jgi:hypothetical protein